MNAQYILYAIGLFVAAFLYFRTRKHTGCVGAGVTDAGKFMFIWSFVQMPVVIMMLVVGIATWPEGLSLLYLMVPVVLFALPVLVFYPVGAHLLKSSFNSESSSWRKGRLIGAIVLLALFLLLTLPI